MRAIDNVPALSNAAATGGSGRVSGGRYILVAHATFGGGTVGVEVLSNDGTTWVPISAFNLTATGAVVSYLPLGTARITVATATAVYATLTRVPAD